MGRVCVLWSLGERELGSEPGGGLVDGLGGLQIGLASRFNLLHLGLFSLTHRTALRRIALFASYLVHIVAVRCCQCRRAWIGLGLVLISLLCALLAFVSVCFFIF
jgi:hypothetical protein